MEKGLLVATTTTTVMTMMFCWSVIASVILDFTRKVFITFHHLSPLLFYISLG